jgi:hypothetical protein
VKCSDQVSAKLSALPPEVKLAIRRALRDVEAGRKRKVHALRAPLVGFSTLAVGRWRVVHRWHAGELIAEYLDDRSDDYRRAEATLGNSED